MIKKIIALGIVACMAVISADAATVSGNRAKAVTTAAAKKGGIVASRAVVTPGLLKKTSVSPLAGLGARAGGVTLPTNPGSSSDSGQIGSGSGGSNANASQFVTKDAYAADQQVLNNNLNDIDGRLNALDKFSDMNIDLEINSDSTDAGLPTSRAVYQYVDDALGGTELANTIADAFRNSDFVTPNITNVGDDANKLVQSKGVYDYLHNTGNYDGLAGRSFGIKADVIDAASTHDKLVTPLAVKDYVAGTLGDIHSALMLINGTAN